MHAQEQHRQGEEVLIAVQVTPPQLLAAFESEEPVVDDDEGGDNDDLADDDAGDEDGEDDRCISERINDAAADDSGEHQEVEEVVEWYNCREMDECLYMSVNEDDVEDSHAGHNQSCPLYDAAFPDPYDPNETAGGDAEDGTTAGTTTGTAANAKQPKFSSAKQKCIKFNIRSTSTITVVIDLEHNASTTIDKRMCSLAAICYDQDGNVLKDGETKEFNKLIKIDRPMTKIGTKVHGLTTASLKNEQLFDTVGNEFWNFVNGCRGDRTDVLLVAHNGHACDFRLLFIEMARYNVAAPSGINLILLDTLSVIKKYKTSNATQLDYWAATKEQWPVRGKPTAAYPDGPPSMKVSSITNFVLSQRPGYPPNATMASYCGEAHDALADVKALSVIYKDPLGVRTKLDNTHFHGEDAVKNLQTYAEKLVAYERKIEEDVVLDPWQELDKRPDDCPPDPSFVPPAGQPATGGPSAELRGHVGDPALQTWEEILLKCIKFYFDDAVLMLLCASILSKAGTMGVMTGNIWRQAKVSDGEDAIRRVMCPMLFYDPVSKGEMFAVLGSLIFRGAIPRRKQTQYWDNTHGFGREEISNTFLQKRYIKVIALLSFEVQGGGTEGDPMRKFRQFDGLVRHNMQVGWYIEPKGNIDESRVRMFSKYCPFTWTMMCKPIRHGCTLYLLVFKSGYIYSWLWWTGKGGQTRTHGQPTDQTPIAEDSLEHGFIQRLMSFLVSDEFDNTFFRLATDKAFNSLKMNRYFDARGVLQYGPFKSYPHPPKEKMKRPAEEYNPFGLSYSKKSKRSERHEKGYVRMAYRKLPSGRYQCVMMWNDSRFVPFVCNCYHADDFAEVQRWSRAELRRVTRNCPFPIKMYNIDMGFVDFVNKAAALAQVRLKRCQKRYHRQLGCWVLGAALHNAKVAMKQLMEGDRYEALKKSHKWIGFDMLQNKRLSERMMAAGVRMAKEECIAAGDASLSPAFMPTRRNAKRGRVAVTIPAPSATIHTYGRVIIDRKEIKRTRCVGCVARIKQAKKKDGATSSANPTQTSSGCQQCKRMLCLACFNNQGCWDHENQRLAACVTFVK
jgi:DNA polymerase III epsilon subunit-like protein